jgi:predicted flap endonuclease-1-like 5' DNA nuclease
VPYTLLKYLFWLLLALVIGVVLGYIFWGRRRTTITTSADVEIENGRLRGRVANLESAAADNDRLKRELEECRAAAKTAAADPAPVATPVATFAGVPQGQHDTVVTERDTLRALVNRHEATISQLEGRLGGGSAAATIAAPPPPDVTGAAAVLGHKIKLNDLKVVEGVGPKIEALIHTTGVTTWWGLANADVGSLRSMLDAAGPRFQIHDPGTWPQQARLLAEGKWEQFKALTDALDGGKSAG